MDTCRDTQTENGLEFVSWTGNETGDETCIITSNDGDVYHYIQITCLKGSNGFLVNAEAQSNKFNFRHLDTGAQGRGWNTPYIKVYPATKSRGTLPQRSREATITTSNTSLAHGRDTIFTQFTYTELRNPTPHRFPPADLVFSAQY